MTTLTPDVTPTLPESGTLLQLLGHCSDNGWLRQLDTAFAHFLGELDPGASPFVLLAASLLSHMEGRGHSCLPLASLCRAPQQWLGWPTEADTLLNTLWQGLPQEQAHWHANLCASPLIQRVGQTPDRGQPLVIDGPTEAPRLYLRRYWHYERSVAHAVSQRTRQPQAVEPATVMHWLNRLFTQNHDTANEPDWQKLACAMALRGTLAIITGGPGTGKTYTAARLLALLLATSPNPGNLRIALAAPTGKAAARLKQSIDGSLQALQASVADQLNLTSLIERLGAARTLHALLGARPDTRRLRHHAGNPLDVDVVIVDEASMVHLEMMAALLEALPPQARLILLGDKDQLASVEAGAVLGDLCRDAQAGHYSPDTARYLHQATGCQLPNIYLHTGPTPPALAQHTVMLRQSRRFHGPIGTLATAVNTATAPQQLMALLQTDTSGALWGQEAVTADTVVALATNGRPGAPGAYRHYLERLAQGPANTTAQAHEHWVLNILRDFDRCRVLCAVRNGEWGVAGLNQAIARALQQQGLLKPTGAWYAGRPVMVTRNEPALGVFNGDIGITLAPPGGGGLRVYFADGEQLRSVAVSRLAHLETAFAMTVHKSQGSEFEHTILALASHSGGVLTRELAYTGITRARQAFSLVAESAGLLATAAQRPTQRASGLWVNA